MHKSQTEDVVAERLKALSLHRLIWLVTYIRKAEIYTESNIVREKNITSVIFIVFRVKFNINVLLHCSFPKKIAKQLL